MAKFSPLRCQKYLQDWNPNFSHQEGDCEVCITVLKRFMDTAVPKEDATKPDKIEAAFKDFCEDLKLKENRNETKFHKCWDDIQ